MARILTGMTIVFLVGLFLVQQDAPDVNSPSESSTANWRGSTAANFAVSVPTFQASDDQRTLVQDTPVQPEPLLGDRKLGNGPLGHPDDDAHLVSSLLGSEDSQRELNSRTTARFVSFHHRNATWLRQPGDPDATSQTLPLDEEGYLLGKLGIIDLAMRRTVAAPSISVNFLQNGDFVARDLPLNDEGVFLARVAPGRYGFVAAGSEGFYITAIRVAPPGQAQTQPWKLPTLVSTNLQNEPVIDGAVVPSVNFGALETILAEQGHELLREALNGRGSREEPEVDSDSPLSLLSLQGYELQLQKFGDQLGIEGRTLRYRDEQHLFAYFIQDGETVDVDEVEANGQFRGEGLEPNAVLSIVVAGSKGLGAFSKFALPPDDQGATIRDVSFHQPEPERRLYVPRATSEDLEAVGDILRRLLGWDGGGAAAGGSGLAGPGSTGGGGGGGGGGGSGPGGVGAAALLGLGAAGSGTSGTVSPFRLAP